MKGLMSLLKVFFGFFGRYGRYLFKFFVPLFVLMNFFFDIFSLGFQGAFLKMAKTLFVADSTIIAKTSLAIVDPVSFGFLDFLAVINAFLIIWFFVNRVGNIFTRVQGANEMNWGRYLVGLLVFVLMEVVAVLVIGLLDGASLGDVFSFIPLVTSFKVLFVDGGMFALFRGVDWFALRSLGLRESLNVSNSSVSGNLTSNVPKHLNSSSYIFNNS